MRYKSWQISLAVLTPGPYLFEFSAGSGNVRMLLRPMQRIVFKFIRISVDGEIIDNDTKSIVWTENILSSEGQWR